MYVQGLNLASLTQETEPLFQAVVGVFGRINPDVYSYVYL